jgi:hypothetical protein
MTLLKTWVIKNTILYEHNCGIKITISWNMTPCYLGKDVRNAVANSINNSQGWREGYAVTLPAVFVLLVIELVFRHHQNSESFTLLEYLVPINESFESCTS